MASHDSTSLAKVIFWIGKDLGNGKVLPSESKWKSTNGKKKNNSYFITASICFLSHNPIHILIPFYQFFKLHAMSSCSPSYRSPSYPYFINTMTTEGALLIPWQTNRVREKNYTLCCIRDSPHLIEIACKVEFGEEYLTVIIFVKISHCHLQIISYSQSQGYETEKYESSSDWITVVKSEKEIFLFHLHIYAS